MARLGSKVMKRRGTQLEIRVRKANHHPLSHPTCQESENIIHLKFVTNTLKNYLHSPTSSLIGEELLTTGTRTLSVDRRDFFQASNELKSYLTISESALEPLNVKADIVHDKIIRQVMRCGERMNKKKDFKGLVVAMTFIKTFVGDRASVLEALMKLDQQRDEYLRRRGGFTVMHVC